jgi:hypothetical protein
MDDRPRGEFVGEFVGELLELQVLPELREALSVSSVEHALGDSPPFPMCSCLTAGDSGTGLLFRLLGRLLKS